MPTRTRRNSQGSPQQQQQQPQQPLLHQHHHGREYEYHRDRSRLAMMLSHPQQRKSFWFLVCGCFLYGYAFFQWQPNRSFEEINRVNMELKQRHELRHAQTQAKRQGLDLDMVPEIDIDEGPEWQRKMRSAAGDMAWRREQEQLAAAGHSNLRGGGGDNSRGYFGEDEGDEEDTQQDNKNPKRMRRRPINGGGGGGLAQSLLDLIVMMSVFVIVRTLLRVCLLYQQFNRMMMESSQGGLNLPPGGDDFDFGGSSSSSGAIPTNRSSNHNSGRAALARLMVPQTLQAHATLLRTARFRAWVTQLNRERQQHGQPPLSIESLRLVMRDSDLTGDDYEALLQFQDEATTLSSHSTTNSNGTGASQDEIDASCLVRVLNDPNDELLRTANTTTSHHNNGNHNNNHNNNHRHECPICLDAYQLQDRVRRIPCCHEFHVQCIDPWLAQRAVCPVCKMQVLGRHR
jgi:Ring finger domain